MKKQDITVFVIGIVIVLILAMVVKPAITGEEVKFLPDQYNTSESPEPLPIPPPTIPQTPIPTPTPIWDGETKLMDYVDPSTYNVLPEENQHYGLGLIDNASLKGKDDMKTYALITGQWGGTTQIINVPFPYWELEININKMVEESGNAAINVQIMNADDPNPMVSIFNSHIEGGASPWTEKMRQGAGNYYFIINGNMLDSYAVKINVPVKYLKTQK